MPSAASASSPTCAGAELRKLRTDLQMVFQDPHAALNPSMTIEEAVGHPLVIHGIAKGEELHKRVEEALEQVGLAPVERFMTKYPSDLSGGQKQRAVIARAIILWPEVIVADEPVSMLDMSVRAKILQLMLDLKRELGLTYVYITHDLASAKYFCDRIAIMYLGRVVEIGPTDEIFANPRHPYTKALLAAIPEPDPERMLPRNLPRGEIPDAAEPPLGCSFHPRCPEAVAECGWESRDLRALIEAHWTRPDAAYDEEQAVLGDLAQLDDPSVTATVGRGGSDQVRAILDGIRAEDRDEPLWTGVESIEPEGSGVRVHFRAGRLTGPAPSRRGRRRLRPLPRGSELLTDLTAGRRATEVASTSGQWWARPRIRDPGGTQTTIRSTTMKTRTALAALTLSALALPLAAMAPASASHGGGGARNHGGCGGAAVWTVKAKADNGRIEFEGEVDSNHRGQVWDWTIKHNGSMSAKGSSTTRGAQWLLHGAAHDGEPVGDRPLRVPCRASRHGRRLPWDHLPLSIDTGPSRLRPGKEPAHEDAAQPRGAVPRRQPPAVRGDLVG